MIVTSLFLKPAPSENMIPVEQLRVNECGILGAPPSMPLRHVLILHTKAIEDFNLSPGDLRENIVVSGGSESLLEPGSELAFDSVRIRLTFFCEACGKISKKVKPRAIGLRRGILGMIVHSGVISIGETVIVTRNVYEKVPQAIADRIKWYLNAHPNPIMLSELVKEIGLSQSYCRAIPGLIRDRSDINRHFIITKNGTPLG